MLHFSLSLLQILHVMDRIEDEMEAHAYEDLVPLEIKLALEDRVFGWTHMTSAFLGHTLFTAGSYWLVFQLVSLCFSGFYGPHWPFWLSFVRLALSLWAAIGTYRMVRRRRRVWFRAPYGSRAYKKDEARRQKSVQETDEKTKLGKMIQAFRHQRVLKRLRKAENMFAEKHESIRRQREMSGSPRKREMSESPPSSPSQSTRLLSRQNSSSSSSSSEDDIQEEVSYASTATSSTASTTSSGLKRRHRRPSFHTNPTSRMESYAHDQTLFPVIDNMPYAHGGFFGAAPFLLANPHWISILRHLMPDVYVEISRRVTYSPPSKLIHWAENNPVVAAYGAAHELEYHGFIPNLEWDVFLDPQLVKRVQLVLEEQDKFLATKKKHSPVKSNQIMAYYDKELQRRSQALVDKMLIAHGNATTLILEQTGYAKHYNYSRVKRTRRTLGGGIYARQWMSVFAEALKLGVCFNGAEDEKKPYDIASPNKKKTSTLLALAESTCPATSMTESIRIVESIIKGKRPIGLVLDTKSQHVPKRIWSIVVDTLRSFGIRVEGIANFKMDEIRGVSKFCAERVQEIIFFHSAGDLQKACHDGSIQQGDKVFFNAGSLLWEPTNSRWDNKISNFDPQEIKASYEVQPFGLPGVEFPTIQWYKEQYDLSIGVYCQEFAIDEAAVHKLSKLINDRPEIYDLGFSWGGVNGITIQGICPGRFTSTDGLWNQRYIGERWNYSLAPMIQGKVD